MKALISVFTFSMVLAMHPVVAQQDSLDIKIGQMILTGIPGTVVDAKVLEEVQKGKVGSLLLFEKNIPSKDSYLSLKKIIWTYQKAAPIPLFVAIDQEGGRVNRLKEKYGFPKSVSAAYLGRLNDGDSTRFYASMMAATLAGLGINVNFAPVVDLASNPDNPIIAKVERSFSADPDVVKSQASVFIEEHSRLGIVTVLKHFPGHGSSTTDTHLGMADVSNTWKENELKPYEDLIHEGKVNAIMTAHIVNTKLDPSGNPSTLSDKIIGGILRGQLGFDGVIFSDDMQMQAITDHYGFEEGIKLAVLAGVDILTFSNNISGSQERTADAVHRIIRKYVEDGTISRERIDQSFHRIIRLKTAGPMLEVKPQEKHENNLLVDPDLKLQKPEKNVIDSREAAPEKSSEEENTKKVKKRKRKRR